MVGFSLIELCEYRQSVNNLGLTYSSVSLGGYKKSEHNKEFCPPNREREKSGYEGYGDSKKMKTSIEVMGDNRVFIEAETCLTYSQPFFDSLNHIVPIMRPPNTIRYGLRDSCTPFWIV